MNSFSLVFFLFKDEHVMVEKLLQLLIGDVDANLLKGIELEDLKPCNIQYTNEESTSILGHKGLVCLFDKPQEHALVQTLCQSTNGVGNLEKK